MFAKLTVENLNKSFGGIQAISDCSFTVEPGSITALIGPNGAGKTTAFNLISGLLKADSGKVIFDGKEIQRLPPHKITRRGISRTFQISRNLEDMTVLENMLVQAPVSGLRDLWKPAASHHQRSQAMELLEFVGLARLAHNETRQLSYGQKKLLDFASMLMAKPRMMMLDEPAGGVNPSLLQEIVGHIQALNQQGMTFFIVEHDMDLVMRICDKVIVMAYGQVLAEGKPEEIQNNPEVLEAYLGKAQA